MSNKYLMQRGWMELPIFAAEPFTEREAFCWMIENAVWQNCRTRCGNVIVSLKRGQLAFSERFLAQKWSWNPSKVHRFLNRLKTEALIETDAKQLVNTITICQYDELQDFDGDYKPENEAANEAGAKQERSKEEHRITPDNTSKNIFTPAPNVLADQVDEPNVLSQPRKKKPQLTTMPEDWKPNDGHRAKCSELGLSLEQLAEEFANYHTSKANRFADWGRAFLTWIGNAKKFNRCSCGTSQRVGNKPDAGSIAEAGLRVAARYR